MTAAHLREAAQALREYADQIEGRSHTDESIKRGDRLCWLARKLDGIASRLGAAHI
jgi:hypothetical protein